MGCGCNKFKKEDNNNEMQNDNVLNIENISNDETKLKSVKKIQRFIRNKLGKKNFSKLNRNNSNINKNSSKENNIKDFKLEIPEEELTKLLNEYSPLTDGITVSINGPVKDIMTQSVYLGEWDFKNNKKHGRGIQYWLEGSKYYGYWISGKANKKGKLIHSDGDIYEGEWLNDQPNGKGKYKHLDGTIYEGDWKNDKQHGKGKIQWPDGTIYEGEYLNGQKHGKGKFIWFDGSSCEGEFANNNINGYGIIFLLIKELIKEIG